MNQKNGLRQRFRPFFGHFDGENQRTQQKNKIKKRSLPGDEGHFEGFVGAYVSLKNKKDRGPGKMPWRVGSGPWAVGCQPLG